MSTDTPTLVIVIDIKPDMGRAREKLDHLPISVVQRATKYETIDPRDPDGPSTLTRLTRHHRQQHRIGQILIFGAGVTTWRADAELLPGVRLSVVAQRLDTKFETRGHCALLFWGFSDVAQVSAGHMGILAGPVFDVLVSGSSAFDLVDPETGDGLGNLVRTEGTGGTYNGFPDQIEAWRWSATPWPDAFRLQHPPHHRELTASQGTWEMLDLADFPQNASGTSLPSGGSWWRIRWTDGSSQVDVGFLHRDDTTGAQRWFGKTGQLNVDGNSKRWLRSIGSGEGLLFDSLSSSPSVSGHVDVSTSVV